MIRDKKSLAKKIWDSPMNPVKKADNALQVISIPSALVAEAYEGISGKGDGKFNFKDAMPKEWGVIGDTGTQKTLSSISHPNAGFAKGTAIDIFTDPTSYIGGVGVYKTIGKKVLKKVGKQIKKLKPMEKIGQFNMPHSPLNYRDEVNKDSIASAKAWKAHKAAYLKKPGGKEEYDREKGEFFYSPKHGKLRLIPTDDGEVQDRSGIEKWQLAPDRKSSKDMRGVAPDEYSIRGGLNPSKTQNIPKPINNLSAAEMEALINIERNKDFELERKPRDMRGVKGPRSTRR